MIILKKSGNLERMIDIFNNMELMKSTVEGIIYQNKSHDMVTTSCIQKYKTGLMMKEIIQES
jgi:hypothetical protein